MERQQVRLIRADSVANLPKEKNEKYGIWMKRQRLRRQELGLSLAEVAAACGFRPGHLAAWEAFECPMPPHLRSVLADFLSACPFV